MTAAAVAGLAALLTLPIGFLLGMVVGYVGGERDNAARVESFRSALDRLATFAGPGAVDLALWSEELEDVTR